MEATILAMQARVLMVVGLAWLGYGLWQGYAPATIAWRAALGAWLAMVVAGKLMRILAEVINQRMAADLVERQMAQQPVPVAAVAEPRRR